MEAKLRLKRKLERKEDVDESDEEGGAEELAEMEVRLAGPARSAGRQPSRGSQAPAFKRKRPFRSRERVLILCSRGVTSRFRLLMEDVRRLIPHHKKDVKVWTACLAFGGPPRPAHGPPRSWMPRGRSTR